MDQFDLVALHGLSWLGLAVSADGRMIQTATMLSSTAPGCLVRRWGPNILQLPGGEYLPRSWLAEPRCHRRSAAPSPRESVVTPYPATAVAGATLMASLP